MTTPRTILLINQYFYPDMAATSQLLGDLAQHLGSTGWRVRALAGRGHYAEAGSAKDYRSHGVWPGVSVRRVWCTSFGRGNLVGRLCDYLTFLASAAAVVALLPKQQIVICLSTPPFLALLGLISKIRGSRLVYKVEDIYPEVAVALSTLRQDSLPTRLLGCLSRFLLRRADCVVTLDMAMSKRLLIGGARSVGVIPNWADGVAIQPDPKTGQKFRQVNGLEDRLVLLYSGNLGLAHGFDAVMEAAALCAVELPEIMFLFVGDGLRLGEVKNAARELNNVRFMAYQPRERLNELYAAADVHLVTLQDAAAGLLFPSKYPAALAAGKPVLLVGGSEAPFAREIQEEKIGWVCPHDANAVMDALRDAAQNPTNREFMSRSARRVFEARYSKTIAMKRWETALKSTLQVSVADEKQTIEVPST